MKAPVDSSKNPVASRRSGISGAFRLLTYLFRHSRRVLVLYLLAATVSAFSNVALMAIINATLTGGADRSLLLWALIGACLAIACARTSSELMLIYIGEGTVADLRMHLSQRVVAIPLRKLEEIGPHRVLSTLTDDIPTITAVIRVLPILTSHVMLLVGSMIYLAVTSWRAFLILIVLMVLGILSYQLQVVRAFKLIQRARELSDSLYWHFRTLTEGGKELRLHRLRRETFLRCDLEETVQGVRNQNVRSARIFTIASTWGMILIFVVIALLLFGLPLITDTSAAVLTGYTLTLIYMMTPLQVLMDSMHNVNRASVALERIEKMGFELDAQEDEKAASAALVASSWHRLELAGVTHVFQREDHEGEFVLGPIDLHLEPGELVLIVGGNGSGKTTLAKILSGLYVPDRGEIRLDGRRVTDENRDAYRQLFSAVFFDFYLFKSLLGLEQADLDKKAEELLAQLQLTGKVRIDQSRLSTTDLSQGQRKRLALLTALLESRPIYIFDEWAADQDPRFKEVFYRHLLPKLKSAGKTAVVITHDDRYFEVADRIIKLEEGQIIQDESLVAPSPIAQETA